MSDSMFAETEMARAFREVQVRCPTLSTERDYCDGLDRRYRA